MGRRRDHVVKDNHVKSFMKVINLIENGTKKFPDKDLSLV